MRGEMAFRWILAGAVPALVSTAAAQQDLDLGAARNAFLKGDYPACLEAARLATPVQADFPAFAALELRCLLETGKYSEAAERAAILRRRAPYDAELSLEAVRAIKARGLPARDVMLIVTDGEEAGLLGANHPLQFRHARGEAPLRRAYIREGCPWIGAGELDPLRLDRDFDAQPVDLKGHELAPR